MDNDVEIVNCLEGSSKDIIGTEEEEIAAIDHELSQLDSKIIKLKNRQEVLKNRKDKLKEQILKRKSEKLSRRNWSEKSFSWSNKVDDLLKNVFKIEAFRPYQLEAINATLCKEDTILIMPTGGGKSLCYQLPALVDNGITLVVSPLLALMQDQIIGLKRLNIPAVMLSANSSKEDNKIAHGALQDELSPIKLIYVTPERLSKSKRFMNALQKCSSKGRLARLAIDEVHCCSVWGHDFRTDYNFLGVLRAMFPDTPLLGLTATSTSKVTLDAQKMLNIQGCLVLKDTFNRPNLYFQVIEKPSSQDEVVKMLENWVTIKFKKQSGIIYTTTIKDSEDLTKELRSRGVKAGLYHAMLDAGVRSRTHERWLTGDIQVVVATVAFGMGIDKPDVRFVIHHTLAKSMESLYQESGRAGRDGQQAHCIVLYRLSDVFKISTMVFTQQTGLDNLYGIMEYCLDEHQCRRSMIAQHFEEVWDTKLCSNMCDHCKKPRAVRSVHAAQYCRSLLKLIQNAAGLDSKLTAIKLLDAWYGKGDVKLRLRDLKAPTLSRQGAERVLAWLLIKGYLKEDFHYTAYSTISYLKPGDRAILAENPNHQIMLEFADGTSSQQSPGRSVDKGEKPGVRAKSGVKRKRADDST